MPSELMGSSEHLSFISSSDTRFVCTPLSTECGAKTCLSDAIGCFLLISNVALGYQLFVQYVFVNQFINLHFFQDLQRKPSVESLFEVSRLYPCGSRAALKTREAWRAELSFETRFTESLPFVYQKYVFLTLYSILNVQSYELSESNGKNCPI